MCLCNSRQSDAEESCQRKLTSYWLLPKIRPEKISSHWLGCVYNSFRDPVLVGVSWMTVIHLSRHRASAQCVNQRRLRLAQDAQGFHQHIRGTAFPPMINGPGLVRTEKRTYKLFTLEVCSVKGYDIVVGLLYQGDQS